LCELGLAWWIFVAVCCAIAMAFWPLTIAALILFAVWVNSPQTVVSKSPVRYTPNPYTERVYKPLAHPDATMRPVQQAFHLHDDEEENYERHFHAAMAVQERMHSL
jgi:hypothetical protein